MLFLAVACPFLWFFPLNLSWTCKVGRWVLNCIDKVALTKQSPQFSEPPADEASLVSSAQRDSAEFAALYDRYFRQIYHYLYGRVGSAAEAEDLTAQTFLAALEALPRYHHRGHFAAWLFTIARNKARDFFRSGYHLSHWMKTIRIKPMTPLLKSYRLTRRTTGSPDPKSWMRMNRNFCACATVQIYPSAGWVCAWGVRKIP